MTHMQTAKPTFSKTGYRMGSPRIMQGWSHDEFTTVYKGLERWKKDGKRDEGLWLHYLNNACAEKARLDFIKHQHVREVDVLGAIVVVSGGVDHLEREVDEIKVRMYFTAKLRSTLQEWKDKGDNKAPLTMEFPSAAEAKHAKNEFLGLMGYNKSGMESAVISGSKLVISPALAKKLDV